MTGKPLTGSRIRERRIIVGLRQAELAEAVGISAPYLNLIEHEKRRIGGKLLVDIARALDVDPSVLSRGAEVRLLEALQDIAGEAEATDVEVDQIEEFAVRFPGWANLLSDRQKHIRKLEKTVDALTDRLAHDPKLAASMHEVLSMVTAVRSTASILFENKELEPEWRARFHRNLNEDSHRLASSSQALVEFLDDTANTENRLISPEDELEALLEGHDYHFPELEEGHPIDEMLGNVILTSSESRELARHVLALYAKDAKAMPIDALKAHFENPEPDFAKIAHEFGVSMAAVMRRVSFLPPKTLPIDFGLVVCDNAGTFLIRKELPEFSLPKFAAVDPHWPLFRALSRPMQPVTDYVDFAGRFRTRCQCIAIAEPMGQPALGRDVLFHAYMLILPKA